MSTEKDLSVSQLKHFDFNQPLELNFEGEKKWLWT